MLEASVPHVGIVVNWRSSKGEGGPNTDLEEPNYGLEVGNGL